MTVIDGSVEFDGANESVHDSEASEASEGRSRIGRPWRG